MPNILPELHKIAEELYAAYDRAVDNNNHNDASLLASRADKLYEEAENLELVIFEREEP